MLLKHRARYMSSDWDAHATAHLIKRAVLSHSSAVKAVVFSLTPGASLRARLFVHFFKNIAWWEFHTVTSGDASGWKKEMSLQLTVVEINPEMSAANAASVIQNHRVMVLVNLNGWTLHDRNDVFALQPSPVQVRRHLVFSRARQTSKM